MTMTTMASQNMTMLDIRMTTMMILTMMGARQYEKYDDHGKDDDDDDSNFA